MIKLMIPGFGPLEISRVVTDYTGTHSFKGVVRRSVRTRLARLARLVEVHVLTIDTFGTARRELARLPVELHFLNNDRRNDKEKQRFVLKYEPAHVAAFGNGTIDRLLLKTVRDAGGLAVAVDNGEGCALEAILNAIFLSMVPSKPWIYCLSRPVVKQPFVFDAIELNPPSKLSYVDWTDGRSVQS